MIIATRKYDESWYIAIGTDLQGRRITQFGRTAKEALIAWFNSLLK